MQFSQIWRIFLGDRTQEDKGKGKGNGYAVNVPLKDGITDEAFKSVFEPVSFASVSILCITIKHGLV